MSYFNLSLEWLSTNYTHLKDSYTDTLFDMTKFTFILAVDMYQGYKS
jgi:hypothetical protein